MKTCSVAVVSCVVAIVGANVALATPSRAELLCHLRQGDYMIAYCLGGILPGKDPESVADGLSMLKDLGVPSASARALVALCRKPRGREAPELLLEALDGASGAAPEDQVVVASIVEGLLARNRVAVEGERREQVLFHHTPEFEGADYSLETKAPVLAYKPKKGGETDPETRARDALPRGVRVGGGRGRGGVGRAGLRVPTGTLTGPAQRAGVVPRTGAGNAPGQPAGCALRRYGDLPWFGTVVRWQGAIMGAPLKALSSA